MVAGARLARGWRALLLFWGIVFAAAAGGACILALLGPPMPPHPALARAEPKAPPAAAPATPARAARFDTADPRPRVGFVLSGMGLDRALSERAASLLPAGIDFARSAYTPPGVADAPTLSAWREAGHECLISVPMEPAGAPEIDAGGLALLTGATPAANAALLARVLAAAPGCVGATGASDGMSGERYAESDTAVAALLDAVRHGGLLYVDPRPGSRPPAGAAGTRFYAVDTVVDAPDGDGEPADAARIDAALAALEHQAAMKGAAIGVAGPPRPVLLERIAIWARGLAARGLALAPVSSLSSVPARASGSGSGA